MGMSMERGFVKRVGAALGVAVTVAGLVGCALGARVTSVSDTFLTDVDVSSKIENVPYEHAWVRPGFDGRRFNKLYIKPVRVDLLPEDQWARSANTFITSKEEYIAEAQGMADYLRQQLVEQIGQYPENRLVLVSSADKETLTLEIALTELEFSHPVARAAALAAPVPGTGPALASITDPHAAFAARITDPTGRLVVTAADRKFPPLRVVDLNKLTVTSSIREICQIWGKTMAEALNKGRFQKTEGEDRFKLLPW